MKRILFQGDSITDGGRNREDPTSLGSGYPNFVASQLGLQQPGAYEFTNRGISGNCIVDLYTRIKRDIIYLKPDYMSILIGVNDVWHKEEWSNSVSAPKFKKLYGMLLEELKEALPELKIILMEPFILSGPFTESSIDWFREEVGLHAEAVKELAEEYQLPLISLQADLDRLSELAPPTYWLGDGMHPTAYFHQYIADKWIETFRSVEK